MSLQTCPRCKQEKDSKEFHKNGYCKPCGRIKSAEAYQRSKAKAAGGGTVKAKAPKANKAKTNGEALILPAAWGIEAAIEDGFLQLKQSDAEGNVDAIMLSRGELAAIIDKFANWATLGE
jgi:hypothetical protein